MSKKILVAGSAGFLGYHLCESLLLDGHTVMGIDDYSTGSVKNTNDLAEKFDKFYFRTHDIRNPITFKVDDFDEIWNFACPASPPKYQADPVGTFLTSIQGVYNLAKFALAQKKCKIFQASTSEVYGDPLVSEQSEDYWGNVNTVGPRSCYDEGKRAAETLLNDMHLQYGLDIRIVRIFNTYGPRMNPYDGRVITNFITQGLKDEQLTVYGSGEQTRSFCYVTDAIKGYRALMDSDITTPVNIGNPNEFKIKDVADMVCDKITSTKYKDKNTRISFHPLPKDDPKQRKPDITKAKKLLGWEPKVQINEGLDYMIHYYKEVIKK